MSERTRQLMHGDTARRTFVLRDMPIRLRAAEFIVEHADDDAIVTVKPAGKTRPQEERYHAMVGDIAGQWEFCNRKWDTESMKRLLIDQFKRDTINDPEFRPLWAEVGTIDMAPSIDGTGVVALGVQSRRFPRKLAAAFITWLFAFGAEVGVEWSNEKAPA